MPQNGNPTELKANTSKKHQKRASTSVPKGFFSLGGDNNSGLGRTQRTSSYPKFCHPQASVVRGLCTLFLWKRRRKRKRKR